jgi:Na+-transporting NADH:ubiquinone oxidoreductase subunit NqrB
MTPLLRDPRLFQIATLSALLAWGLVVLDLEVRPAIAATILAVALGTQLAATRLCRLPRFDPKSALISALSLTLLLRTASPALAAAAAVLAIGSKFVLRLPAAAGGSPKHIYNPTNFGLAALLLATDRAWVSPGQWGAAALAAFAVACAGMLVVRRAERSDVTWAFLAAYGAVVFGRALWLGDPLAIPLHQVSNGAFLIFAFFMISDPKTTPDSRAGRILFAVLVAAGAGCVHFVLFRPNGLIWSLAALSPLVPVLDRVLPGRRYRWPGGEAAPAATVSRVPAAVAAVPRPAVALTAERSPR